MACVVFSFAAVTLASDPPHWYSESLVIGCTEQCHVLHAAEGSTLTQAAGNVNLCQSCHNSSGLADQAPMPNYTRAIPGSRGTSHAFDVPALHGTYSTQRPLDTQMDLRVMNDNIVCSTCHNQHTASSARGGTPKISQPVPVVDLGGNGDVSSQGTYGGAAGAWYLLEIDGGGDQTNATFRWSKDNGVSWMDQNAAVGNGLPVTLDSGVEVVFTGAAAGDFTVGEQWELFGTWPFLRATLDDAVNKFCRDCHRDWDMTHTAVETWDGNFKSHPVGVGLNVNLRDYDRAQPLDGNGVAQSAGASPDADSNASNDLALDSAGNVQCLTCHAVHYADSNTKSVDGP
jgi:hypothetical protein